jgi:hypothetical protein
MMPRFSLNARTTLRMEFSEGTGPARRASLPKIGLTSAAWRAQIGAATSRRRVLSEDAGRMRRITPGRSVCFALAIASIVAAAPGITQDTPKFDCARLAPSVQRAAREMSALLPEIEKTDVETTLKDKVAGELARTLSTYSQARHALLKPLMDYRDSLEELAHLLQRCAR